MKSKNQKGFTFIEIMLVVVIISVLASMVALALRGRSRDAKVTAAKTDIETISAALDLYELSAGAYPTTEQGLEALISKPSASPEPDEWKGPYIKKKKSPADPWGNPYQYTCPGRNNRDGFDMKSFGPDGVEGGGDDIANWE
jgi:general secretion pathway protein G